MPRYAVAKLGEIPDGRARKVSAGGMDILLCNAEGRLYALEDVCTHDGAPLDQGELEGCRIVCPRHGANFDVRTGEALTLPAFLPLPTYEVTVEGDDVFVDV
ncbi:MAG TPA: non-heme iron oxygenase ferredoxin subunit [Candidatus Baltobacteraceae bacterium]|nr:non-heme iron oxygenase ferredoxin subunit [Candidatus Baltobacteraceae bacterium]